MENNTPSPDSRDHAVEDWLERAQMDANQPIRDEVREPMERMLPRRSASQSSLPRQNPTFENPSENRVARSRSHRSSRRRATPLTVDLPSNLRRQEPPTLSSSSCLQRDAPSSFGNLPSNYGSERIPALSSSRQVPIPSTLDNLPNNRESPRSQSNLSSRQSPILSNFRSLTDTRSLPYGPSTVSEHLLPDLNALSSHTSFPLPVDSRLLPLSNNQLPNIFTMPSSLTSSGLPFDSNRPSLEINRLPDTLASSTLISPPEESNHPSRNRPDTFILPSIRSSTGPTADWNRPTVRDLNPSQSTLAVPYRLERLGNQSTDSNQQEDVRPSIIENIGADENQKQVSLPSNLRRHSAPCIFPNMLESSQLALVENSLANENIRSVTLKLEASGEDVSEGSISSEDYERPLELRSYFARQASSLQGPVVLPDNLSRIDLPDDGREYCFSLPKRYIDFLPCIPDDELQEKQSSVTWTPSSEPLWLTSAIAGDSDMDCEKLNVESEDLLAARSDRIWSSVATAGDSDTNSEILYVESEDLLAARSELLWSSVATAGDSETDSEILYVESEDLLAARSELLRSSVATAGDSDTDSEILYLESENTLAAIEPQILSPGQRNTGAIPKQPSNFQRKCLQLLQSKSSSQSTKNDRMSRSQKNVQDLQPNNSRSQLAMPGQSYQFFSPLPSLFPSVQTRLKSPSYAQRHRIELANSPLRCSRMSIEPFSERFRAPRGLYQLSGTSHDQAQNENVSHSNISSRRSYPLPRKPLRRPKRASLDLSEHCSDSRSPSPDGPILRRTIDIYLPREHASPIQNEASSRYQAGAVIERITRVFPQRLSELVLPIQTESVCQEQNVPVGQPLDTFIPSGEPSTEILVETGTEILVETGTEILVEPSAQVVGEPSAQVVGEPSAQVVGEPSAQVLVEPGTQILVEPSNEIEASVSQISGQPNNQTSDGPNNQTSDAPISLNIDESKQTSGVHGSLTFSEQSRQTSSQTLSRHSSSTVGGGGSSNTIYGLKREFINRKRPGLLAEYEAVFGKKLSSNINSTVSTSRSRERKSNLSDTLGSQHSSRSKNQPADATVNQTSSGHPSAHINDQHSGEPSCPIMSEPRSEPAVTQQASIIAEYLARPPLSNVSSRSQSAPSSRTQSRPSIQLPNRLSIPVESRGHPQYENQDNLHGITLYRSTSLPSLESNGQLFMRPSGSTLNSVNQFIGHPKSGSSGHPQSESIGHPQIGSSGHPQSGSSGHPQSESSGQPQAQEQPKIDHDSVYRKGPKSARHRIQGSPSQRRHSPLIGHRTPSQIGLHGALLKEHQNETRGPDPQNIPVSGHEDQLQKGTVQKCESSDEPGNPTLVPSSAQFLGNTAEQDSKLVCDSSNQTSGDPNTEVKIEPSSQSLAEPSSQQLGRSSSPPMFHPIRRLEYFKQYMKPVVQRQSLFAEYLEVFGKPPFSNAENIRSQSAPGGRSQSSLLPESGRSLTQSDQRSPTPSDRGIPGSKNHTPCGHSSTSTGHRILTPSDHSSSSNGHSSASNGHSSASNGHSSASNGHRSATPSGHRSATPSGHKSATPSGHKSATPSGHKSATPSGHKSATPSGHKSATPSSHKSATPSGHKSATPSGHESATPSGHESAIPSGHKSATPSGHKSATPSVHKSATPSGHKSATPSGHKSATPSGHKSATPSGHRSTTPSGRKNPTPSGHNRSQNEYSGLPQSGHSSQPQSVAASLTSEQGSFVFKQPIGPVRRSNSQSVKLSSQYQTPSLGASPKGSNTSSDKVSQEILKFSSNAQTSNVDTLQKESQTSSQPASQTDMPTALDLSSGRKLTDKMASSSSVTHSLEDRSPRGNVHQSRNGALLNQCSGPQSSQFQQSSVNNTRPQIFGSQQALRGPPENHSLFQASLMYNTRASRAHTQQMNDLRPLITPLTLHQRSTNIRPRPSPRSHPLQVAPLDFSLPSPRSLPVTRRQLVQTAEHHHMPIAQPVNDQSRARPQSRRNIFLRRWLDRSQPSDEFQPSQRESFNNNIQMVEAQSMHIVDTNIQALQPQSLHSESLDSEMLETQSFQSESLDFMSTDVDSDMPSLKTDSLQSESLDFMSTGVDSDMPSLKTESLPRKSLDNLMSYDKPIPTRMESVGFDVQRDEPMQTQSESRDSKMPSAEPMQTHRESFDSDTPSLAPRPLRNESLDNVMPTVEPLLSPGDCVDTEMQRDETQPTQRETCNLPTDEPKSLQNESLDNAETMFEPLLSQNESVGIDIQRDRPQSAQNKTLNLDQSYGGARPKQKKKSSPKKDSRRRGSKSSTSSSISGTERRVLIKITCPECAAKRGITLTKKQLSLYFKNKDTVGKCCCYRCYVFLRPGEVHPMRQISCQELPPRILTSGNAVPEETGELTNELETSQRPIEQEVSSDHPQELPQDNLQSDGFSRPNQQHDEGNDFTKEEHQRSLEDSERITQPIGDEAVPDPSLVGVNNGASFGTFESDTGLSERPSGRTYPGLLEAWEGQPLDPGFFTLDVNSVRNMVANLDRTYGNEHFLERISEESSEDADN